MPRVLIIGGGLTGGVTAGLLRRERSDIEVILWEKESEIGGRMNTTPSPDDKGCTADLGPQFVIATLQCLKNHAQFYNELLEDNVLVSCNGELDGMKLPPASIALVAPLGIGSLTQHFFDKAGAEVCLKHQAQKISFHPETGKWYVSACSGETEIADVVILAIPVPQVLELEGDIKEVIEKQEGIKYFLERISYTPKYSLGLYYYHRVEYLENLPWCAKLYRNDDIVQFISIDNRKRESPTALPGLAIQTTIPFSWLHFDHNKQKVEELIFERVNTLLPNLPKPDGSHLKHWIFAKVDNPHPEYIGCLILYDKPLLIAGGDGFTQSSFNGCIDSAMRIVEEVLKYL